MTLADAFVAKIQRDLGSVTIAWTPAIVKRNARIGERVFSFAGVPLENGELVVDGAVAPGAWTVQLEYIFGDSVPAIKVPENTKYYRCRYVPNGAKP